MVTVRNLATKAAVSPRPYCTVEQVSRVLYHHGIGGLPVLNNQERIIGMVTEADILSRRTGQETIQDVMSAPARTISQDSVLKDIDCLGTQKRVKRVPVVHDGQLVGIFSRADTVPTLASHRT